MLSNLKAIPIALVDTLKTVIREQAKIIILEDDPEMLESMINLLIADGYQRKNLTTATAVEDYIENISLGLCPPIEEMDLFISDQYLAKKFKGTDLIAALQRKHMVLEKHRFILVSGQLSEEEAVRLCPLIYTVFDKGSMNTISFYSAIESALSESFSVKYQLQEAANQEWLTTPHLELTLSGEESLQYKKTLRLFEEWFLILTKKLSPADQNHQRFISMKNKFLTAIDYLFTHTKKISWPVSNSIQEMNIAHLGITALLTEPNKDPSKILARRKKLISFLLQDYLKSSTIYYQESMSESLIKVHSWLALAERANCFTMKRKYSSEVMIERLAAIFYISPLRHKEFIKTYISRIDDITLRLKSPGNKGFEFPAHKFKNNNILFEDLIGFVQKLFD